MNSKQLIEQLSGLLTFIETISEGNRYEFSVSSSDKMVFKEDKRALEQVILTLDLMEFAHKAAEDAK